MNFSIVWPCVLTDSLWIKPTDALDSNFIGITTLHVSVSLFAHHQEFLAVHRLWYILCICDRMLPGVGWNAVPSYSWQQTVTTVEQDRDGTAVPSWSCSKAVYKHVWHIPLLGVQWINSWWWTDELSETCRVSCQNKFVKLVHLVDFIIKKFVTIHGHMNVKFGNNCQFKVHVLFTENFMLNMLMACWWISTGLIARHLLQTGHSEFCKTN